MVEKLFQEILEGKEVRQNLSSIRAQMKDACQKNKVEDLIDIGNYKSILALLGSEDAKTRKNVALFMGDLDMDGLFMEPLYHAYEKEAQLFVKSSYLTALKGGAYEQFLPKMKDRLEELEEMEFSVENKKHFMEEQRLLTELIADKEGIEKHTFVGFNEKSEIVLLTNRNHVEITKQQLEEIGDFDSKTLKAFSAGLILKTNQLEEISQIRTYTELLFRVNGMKECELDANVAAKQVVESDLMGFLKKRHSGSGAFYFRVEVKGKMGLDEKTKFSRRFSQELESMSGRKLINSTSHYEIELRFVENKKGIFNAFVKLYTWPDERFSYRKEVIASSIKPVNAALLVQLAKEYMVEDAQVLDPFCGVGTMLIERQKIVKANTSYGIDYFKEGIEKAKINTRAAGQIIHFVNKDMFEFTHEYKFDEIFTNMPFAMNPSAERQVEEIYQRFFRKARTLLAANGRVILYTHNREWIASNAQKAGFRIEKTFEINRRERTDLYILESIL